MSVHAGVVLASYYLCVIINKVFLMRKILSLETILSAHTHTHTHTRTHTHAHTHTHTLYHLKGRKS